MPGERPTRTESIFVRPNVLPPPRPAPFFTPFHRPPPLFAISLHRSRDSLRSHGTREPSISPLPPHGAAVSTVVRSPRRGINVINCPGSRYRISIRDETDDDDHLTRRTRRELVRSVRLEKREPARERCAFQGGTEEALFCDRRRPSTDFLFS